MADWSFFSIALTLRLVSMAVELATERMIACLRRAGDTGFLCMAGGRSGWCAEQASVYRPGGWAGRIHYALDTSLAGTGTPCMRALDEPAWRWAER